MILLAKMLFFNTNFNAMIVTIGTQYEVSVFLKCIENP